MDGRRFSEKIRSVFRKKSLKQNLNGITLKGEKIKVFENIDQVVSFFSNLVYSLDEYDDKWTKEPNTEWNLVVVLPRVTNVRVDVSLVIFLKCAEKIVVDFKGTFLFTYRVQCHSSSTFIFSGQSYKRRPDYFNLISVLRSLVKIITTHI